MQSPQIVGSHIVLLLFLRYFLFFYNMSPCLFANNGAKVQCESTLQNIQRVPFLLKTINIYLLVVITH